MFLLYSAELPARFSCQSQMGYVSAYMLAGRGGMATIGARSVRQDRYTAVSIRPYLWPSDHIANPVASDTLHYDTTQ